MSDSNQRKTGVILSYVSIAANTFIQLLYTPFLVKMLGQSEYGLYSLVSSIIGYLTVLDLGFGNAIIVYTAKYRAQKKYDEEKKLHGMFFAIFCFIGVIATLIGIVLFLNIENIFSNTMTSVEIEKAKIMMLILTFNLAVTFVFNIYSSIITAYEKFTFQKILSICNSMLRPILMIPLLFLGFKSITMTLVMTIINVATLLSNYIYCRKKLNVRVKYQGFDTKVFKTIFGYSIFIFLGIIVDKANWSVDQFILGAVSGTVAVSIYSIASQINLFFINISTAVSGVMLPKVSKMIVNNATSEELTKEFIKVGRLQYYIIFLMASGFVLFGKQFIILWAGNGFEESYYVTLLLVIPVCFPLIQNLGLSIMQAMNKYKFKAISTFIMAIINIIVSYFLAKSYGVIGTAIGTAGALILCNIILINIYYYKVIKLDVIKFWEEIIKMIIVSIIPIIIILTFMHFIDLSGIKAFIIYGSIYTLIYCINSYFLIMNKYEKNIIHKFVNKIKRRKYD